MITAVDSNVLLDILVGDPSFGPGSRMAVRESLAKGVVVACEVVWAEVTAAFPQTAAGAAALGELGVEFQALTQPEAELAAQAWRLYRQAGGPRERLLPDFLVGAHASSRVDRLLTRDRGFYRRWFDGLRVLDPSSG